MNWREQILKLTLENERLRRELDAARRSPVLNPIGRKLVIKPLRKPISDGEPLVDFIDATKRNKIWCAT